MCSEARRIRAAANFPKKCRSVFQIFAWSALHAVALAAQAYVIKLTGRKNASARNVVVELVKLLRQKHRMQKVKLGILKRIEPTD